jgi:peptidoglycan/xylan/chitin deacetylase (PgdA/CDA1 family)
MITWKEIALSGYYLSTLRARREAATRRAAERREPVRILFYHRIAGDNPNAWTMRPKSFAAQVDWLRERFDLISLAAAQERIASGQNRWPAASITFDDGYADNRRGAIPLLLKYRIPFTYFVSTNHVLRGESFPHDVKAGRPLAVNTLAHLGELVAAGAEIGAHTRNHADLGSIASVEQLRNEIVGSKHELEDALGVAVRYFAFPYGQHANMSGAAFRIAYEAGFSGVCSAYGGYNFPGDDPFHLRRFHADEEFIRFVNWMTVDPRKLRLQHDFDPGDFRTHSTVRHGDDVAVATALADDAAHLTAEPSLMT